MEIFPEINHHCWYKNHIDHLCKCFLCSSWIESWSRVILGMSWKIEPQLQRKKAALCFGQFLTNTQLGDQTLVSFQQILPAMSLLTYHIWILNKNFGAEIFSSIHNQDCIVSGPASKIQTHPSKNSWCRITCFLWFLPLFICEKFKETLKLRMQSLQLEESVKFDFWTTHTDSTWRTKQWQS